jgi:hypothetical protein
MHPGWFLDICPCPDQVEQGNQDSVRTQIIKSAGMTAFWSSHEACTIFAGRSWRGYRSPPDRE